MRENIGLFKAKEVIYKTSVEGSLIKTNCGGLNPNELHNIPKECIFVENECNCYYQIQEEYYPFLTHNIDPETLCEYTGLKDKHGNKIWEGDVILHTLANKEFSVIWENGLGFRLNRISDNCNEFLLTQNFCDKWAEVTGNRFD